MTRYPHQTQESRMFCMTCSLVTEAIPVFSYPESLLTPPPIQSTQQRKIANNLPDIQLACSLFSGP